MKTLLILAVLLLAMPACSTRPDGSKTFAGLDAYQWGGLAVQTGSSYLDKRKQAAAKAPVTSAKDVVEIQPVTVEAPKPSLFDWLSWF